jgi:outer membrane protein OmpA-like peptidoglycan-associated protein
MFKKTLLAGLVLSLSVTPAMAAGNPSKEETTGVGAGLVIGAIAAGPVGGIIGAALGAKLGDEFHERNESVDSLSASLSGSQAAVAGLERDILALQSEVRTRDMALRDAEERTRPELQALLQAGIEMDLLFRTDEHVLADDTGARLQALAASLVANPDIRIRLDGYADERGDEVYNQGLSARRVEHVREVLAAAGVPADRISVNAHGESPATEQTTDSFALERRVSLTLYIDQGQSFASNPR